MNQRDLQEVGITFENIHECDPLKKKLGAHQGFRGKLKLRTGKTWSEERKEAHRNKRMQ